MTPLPKLAPLLDLPALADYTPDEAFSLRDEIKNLIASRLHQKTVKEWLTTLEPADIWATEVLDWPQLLETAAFRQLDMLQTVTRGDGISVRTTASPIRVNGQRHKTISPPRRSATARRRSGRNSQSVPIRRGQRKARPPFGSRALFISVQLLMQQRAAVPC